MLPNERVEAEPAVPSWPRRLRHASALVALLTLLWSTAWFFVPPLIASQAQKAVAQKLGRSLALGRVTFNPWTLEVSLLDIAIAGAQAGSPPQLSVKRAYANVSISSLWRLAPVIDRLEVDVPMLRLTRLAAGRYDIDDVLERLAAAPAAADAAAGAAPLPRFAVHNIVLRGGSAEFDDRPLARVHRVSDLQFGIPFVSTLSSERRVTVEPHLSFVLDGSRFDSTAAATPWSEAGQGEARLRFDRVDLAPYLAYLPESLTARPKSGRLSADLRLVFEQRPKLSLRISGSVQADSVALVDQHAQPLLEVKNIQVAIDELRPLDRSVRVSRIDVEAPHLLVNRDAAGHIGPFLPASAPPDGNASTVSPWKATLAALSVRAGRLDWRDSATAPPAELALTDFSLDAQAIHWPLDAPLAFKGEGQLGTANDHGKVAFSGQADAAGATAQVEVVALPLIAGRPYLHDVLDPTLAGELTAQFAVDWRPAPAGALIKLDATRIALGSLLLGDARAPEIAAESVELLDAHIDTSTRIARVGKLALQAPRFRLERDAQGAWNFTGWAGGGARAPAGIAALAAPVASRSGRAVLASASSSASAAFAVSAASAPAAPTAWKLSVEAFAIENGRARFADRSFGEPVELDISDVNVQATSWALDASATAFRLMARVAGSARAPGAAVRSGRVAGRGPGSIDIHGEMKGLASGIPSSVKAALLLRDLPLHRLEPYVQAPLDIDVQRAQASFNGDVAWKGSSAGSSLRLHGDALLADVRVASRLRGPAGNQRQDSPSFDTAPARELMNWKTLSMRGIDVALAPDAPARIAIAETALSDFFARIVLDESGRLNLQDVAQSPQANTPVAPASAGLAAAAAAPPPTPAASAASAPGSSSTPSGAVFDIGPVSVANGRVNYNDRFVKPNYTTDISELNGTLAAFSSRPSAAGVPQQLAALGLRGRVEGTASLDIAGRLNPLVRPLALDLTAKVRDLELPPLSPYAIKYSGYGIERGKMSVDLAYVVKPDGQLTASNRIVLNQLAFGDKVEGSTASLPVKLAVALLANRDGVVDLDLPVQGSINDPQFSIGGLIWKVVANLVTKAITSPFSLLASAFGGGSGELSAVDFAPGTALLDAAAKERLDKVAQALAERPALTLTVSGEARLDVDRDGWKRENLDQRLRSEKRRQTIAAGASPSTEVTVDQAERPALLRQVYERAEIAKPKNLIGFAKDIPAAQMEVLLLDSTTVPDEAMQQLGTARAAAVRDYLTAKALPTSRIFVGATKSQAADGGPAWAPHAELNLASR